MHCILSLVLQQQQQQKQQQHKNYFHCSLLQQFKRLRNYSQLSFVNLAVTCATTTTTTTTITIIAMTTSYNNILQHIFSSLLYCTVQFCSVLFLVANVKRWIISWHINFTLLVKKRKKIKRYKVLFFLNFTKNIYSWVQL